MVFAALRGSTNGLQSPALERYVNLALSKMDSRGPSAYLLIWSIYKAVVVEGDEEGDGGDGAQDSERVGLRNTY